MQAEKVTTITVKDSNNEEVLIGDKVCFLVDGRILTGTFKGINAKGCWNFEGYGQFEDVKFTVHPKTIRKMYKE